MLANKFSYRLTVIPCKYCKSTDIELYEDKQENDNLVKVSTGGAVCQVCKHTVKFDKLPQVPSMTMLLNEWNKYNAI